VLFAPRHAGPAVVRVADLLEDTAEYGFMLWAARSKRTIDDVVNLCREGEPVVVSIAPKKHFLAVKAFDDLRGVLARGETESVGVTSLSLGFTSGTDVWQTTRFGTTCRALLSAIRQ
jgi:hypothetical protein